MIRVIQAAAVLLFAAWSGGPGGAQEDRYVGYYYPEITSTEMFTRLIPSPRIANRAVRVDFVTRLTKGQLSAPAPPRFAMFAKGEAAQHLVIIGLRDDTFATLYRARAVMAQMTANVRSLPMFAGDGLQFHVTFYDLLQFLEFDTLVLSDGRDWAHKVEFKR